MNQVTPQSMFAVGVLAVGVATVVLACEPAAEPATASNPPVGSSVGATDTAPASPSVVPETSSTAVPTTTAAPPPTVSTSTATSSTDDTSSAVTDGVPASDSSAPAASASASEPSSGAFDSSEPAGSVATSSAADSSAAPPSAELIRGYAEGFSELYLHDECTDDNPADDVCAHARTHEVPFTFGGDSELVYAVTLRIRGLFEPTNIAGGETPYPEAPFFKVGGSVAKTDYSQWQIRIGEPAATYYLNHYPSTGHTIYQEDFEATISVRGQSSVVVRVEDSNDRQIDNGYVGLEDRQQLIVGVTDGVVDGQVLRLDVLDVVVMP